MLFLYKDYETRKEKVRDKEVKPDLGGSNLVILPTTQQKMLIEVE